MLDVMQSGHDCRDHFAFEACKSPRLRSKLHDAFHGNLDTFFFPGISKMLDGVDNFFDDRSSRSVDALLGTGACESCKKCLLTPDCFFSCTLLADVVAHRRKQRVGFVITTTKAEQEGTKDAIGDQLGHCVNNVCCSDLSVTGSPVSRRSLIYNIHAYLEAMVSPRNDGRLEGTCPRSSGGGRTGRWTKWVVARSMICFCR